VGAEVVALVAPDELDDEELPQAAKTPAEMTAATAVTANFLYLLTAPPPRGLWSPRNLIARSRSREIPNQPSTEVQIKLRSARFGTVRPSAMPDDAIQELARQLRATPPNGLQVLSPDELRDLAGAVRDARHRQAAALEAAGEQAFQQIPKLLRGPIRKLLQ
jgi:hypothetical protein